MSEIVERVARAICAETGESPWDAAPDWMKNDYRKEARAAIAAMREPDENMKLAAMAWDYNRNGIECYQLMMDAALG